MIPGALPHRVTIQRLVSSQDEYGQPLEAWQDVATVCARVEDLSGREYFAAQEIPTAEVSTRVTIRWRPDVKPEMRLLCRGRAFNIKAALDPDGRRRELQLMCTEVTL